MKPRIVDPASRALEVSNANPFPVLGRPRLTQRVANQKADHRPNLLQRDTASVIALANRCLPLPQPAQPQPKKPDTRFHRLTILRFVARVKRIFS